MKETIKITTVLTVTCVVCAFLLALVNSAAKEKIAMNNKKKIDEAIFTLVPSAKKVETMKLEDEVIYKLFDGKETFLGHAFLAKGDGYQGTIKILTVVSPSLDGLQGIQIIESVETPGLGARIKDVFFTKQFKKLNVSLPIECVKEEIKKSNQIQAISSATISSRSVVNILNKKIAEIKNKMKK